MRNTKQSLKSATWRGMAALMAAVTVFHVGPARSAPADIFANPAPVLASEPGKAAPIADGDTSVASQTGALNYSFPISVPPGPMAPHLSLSYSSQGAIYGGLASGWSWNLSIPEIREDVSSGRIRTHHPNVESTQADPKLDDRFVSTMAGGRPLVMVTEPGDPAAYQYRAQGDTSFARYERMKSGAAGYWWRVYTTDGVTRYFGESSSTLGCVNVSEGFAPLTREVDSFGWESIYTYESAVTGECRIKNIKYGKNSGAGVNSFAQVDFQYSPTVQRCEGIPVGSQRAQFAAS